MKSRFLAAKISLANAFALAAPSANAQISVIDVANVRQTTVSALQNVATVAKQIQQYQTQLQQYQNMIQNTVGAPVQLWQQATQTIDSLQSQVNQISSFARQAGDVNTYMNQFKIRLTIRPTLAPPGIARPRKGQRLCLPRVPARLARWPQMPTL